MLEFYRLPSFTRPYPSSAMLESRTKICLHLNSFWSCQLLGINFLVLPSNKQENMEQKIFWNKPGGGKDSNWVHCKYWNGEGVDVHCMHYVHIIFKEKIKSKTLVLCSLIPTLTVTTEIWAVVCECVGHNLVRIENFSQQRHIFSDYWRG
jgi:hypothetical protein